MVLQWKKRSISTEIQIKLCKWKICSNSQSVCSFSSNSDYLHTPGFIIIHNHTSVVEWYIVCWHWWCSGGRCSLCHWRGLCCWCCFCYNLHDTEHKKIFLESKFSVFILKNNFTGTYFVWNPHLELSDSTPG